MDKTFEEELIQRLRAAREDAVQARKALERAEAKAKAIEALMDAEEISIPESSPESNPAHRRRIQVPKRADSGHTGYSTLGFRGTIFKVLANNPQGMRAKEIADWIESTDYEQPPDAKTDLVTRVANECSKLVRKKRLKRAARGVFILPKEKSPDAATSGLFESSANGRATTTDADGAD